METLAWPVQYDPSQGRRSRFGVPTVLVVYLFRQHFPIVSRLNPIDFSRPCHLVPDSLLAQCKLPSARSRSRKRSSDPSPLVEVEIDSCTNWIALAIQACCCESSA